MHRISPAHTRYEAKAPRTPLRIESATPTIKPISAHLPIALARTGVVFWKHRNRIRPITGNKNASMFRPVDGLSSYWLTGACTAQPQFGHTTASQENDRSQIGCGRFFYLGLIFKLVANDHGNKILLEQI